MELTRDVVIPRDTLGSRDGTGWSEIFEENLIMLENFVKRRESPKECQSVKEEIPRSAIHNFGIGGQRSSSILHPRR